MDFCLNDKHALPGGVAKMNGVESVSVNCHDFTATLTG
jgi:hypothetical protein